jgi:hypothetical protein
MNSVQHCPNVPVSWGELLDKITILQIKRERIAGAQARANVMRELALLGQVAGDVIQGSKVAGPLERLRSVNEELWDVEDAIREHEAAGNFGHSFVRLARSVYQKNDQRAALKRQINDLLGSVLIEEKSYAGAAKMSQQEVANPPQLQRRYRRLADA